MKLITKPQITFEEICIPEYAPQTFLDKIIYGRPTIVGYTYTTGRQLFSKFVVQTDTPIKIGSKKQYLKVDDMKIHGIRFIEVLNSNDNMYLCVCDLLEYSDIA